MKRVLILNHHGIGDVVNSTALVLGIRRRFPASQLVMLVRNPGAALLFPPGTIDEVLLKPSSLRGVPRLLGQLLLRPADLMVCTAETSHSWFALVASVLSRSGNTVMESTARRSPMRQTLVDFNYGEHKFESNCRIAQAAGVDQLEGVPRVYVADAWRTAARKLLGEPHRPIVAVCPGSQGFVSRRWPTERFAQCMSEVADQGTTEFVILGDRTERELGALVIAQLPAPVRERVRNLAGELDFATAIGVLAESSAVLSNDSGLSHIAAGVGTPTVVVFGPTQPARCRPYANARVVWQPPSCAPCFPRLPNGCVEAGCMTRLPVEPVVRELTAVLDRHSVA